MTEQPPDKDLDDVDAARATASDAYAGARHDVYDTFPKSLVDPAVHLTQRQEDALAKLDEAEEHLDDMREKRREETEDRAAQD